MQIRPAEERDYDTFVRLSLELKTGDPMRSRDAFVRDIVPGTIVAEECGVSIGYAYAQYLESRVYIRHLVTAPEARGRGVARQLMQDIASRAKQRGCSGWTLNVKPDNVAALALYTSLGFAPLYESQALRLKWSDVPALALPVVHIGAKEAAAYEKRFEIDAGQVVQGLLSAIALAYLDADGEAQAFALFNADFPGAFPFKVNRPELALPFVSAFRPFARREHDTLNLVIENQPATTNALVAHGATETLRIVRMAGRL
jgi:GNAT superfamily N-acetyltransferase